MSPQTHSTPFHQLNPAAGDTPPPSPLPASFTLAAQPNTDIWRKPPSTFSFNAPILYHNLNLASFKRARVTVSGPWKALYDQGGLCLFMPTAAKEGEEEEEEEKSWKWVKTGIEFYEGTPHVGTVACDAWADWSLHELEGGQVTVEVEREVENRGEKTASLWVYVVGKGGKRRPIREITWMFEDVLGREESEKVVCVGVYAARPKMDEDNREGKLKVAFTDVVIETWQGLLEL